MAVFAGMEINISGGPDFRALKRNPLRLVRKFVGPNIVSRSDRNFSLIKLSAIELVTAGSGVGKTGPSIMGTGYQDCAA